MSNILFCHGYNTKYVIMNGIKKLKKHKKLTLKRSTKKTTKIGETWYFSERSDKIGRGFIKILETWQFGLSFNIIRHVFFCFGQKKFLSVLWIFEKFWSCSKKNRKITLLAVNYFKKHVLTFVLYGKTSFESHENSYWFFKNSSRPLPFTIFLLKVNIL
jgi:hypothetical protein